MNKSCLLFLVLLSFLLVISAQAQTIYVKPSASGSGDGSSWSNATTLPNALTLAIAGNEIRVAGGTYLPTTTFALPFGGSSADLRTATFLIPLGVVVDGGYNAANDADLSRTTGPSNTTLSGDIGTAGDNTDNSYHVVLFYDADPATQLNGVVVTLGNADKNGEGPVDRSGGGIFVYTAGPLAAPPAPGRRLVAAGESSPTITNCLITTNNAINGGGGLAAVAADFGTVSPTVNGCIFQNNTSELGGAVFLAGPGTRNASTPSFASCIFRNNNGYQGGAVHISNNNNVTMKNCLITDNSVGFQGGGVYTRSTGRLTATNCTIANNTVGDGNGGGVFNESATPGAPAPMGTLILLNGIIWGNTPDGISNTGSSDITYSNLQDGLSGTGNINADPLFVNSTNYRLQNGSPSINTGDPASTVVTVSATDLDGINRVQGARIDMGPYERAVSPPGSPTVSGGTSQTVCQEGESGFTIFASCPTSSTVSFLDENGNVSQSSLFVGASSPGVRSYSAICTSTDGLTSATPITVTILERPVDPPTISYNPVSGTITAGAGVTITATCTVGSPIWSNASTMNVIVTPTTAGVYPFTVFCRTAPGCEGPDAPVSATVVAPPVSTTVADIALPKVDVSRRTPAPGERVRFVTQVENQDSKPATNIVIGVQMPAGYVYSTDNSPTTDPTSTTWANTPVSPGTTFDAGMNKVTQRLGTLAPGQRVLLFFYGLVPPTPTVSTASDANKYYAYWEIESADQLDSDSPHGNGYCNGEDDTQAIDMRVNVPTSPSNGADVELYNFLSVSNLTPAQNEVITVNAGIFNNQGPLVATNVITRFTLPLSLSFAGSTTADVSYDPATRNVTLTAASIAVNATKPFGFRVRVLAESGSKIEVRGEIKSSDQFDHDSVFGNESCNNYDDDSDVKTLVVAGVMPPTTNPNNFTLTQPTYNCATGIIVFNTTGGDGTAITYTAVGVSRPGNAGNVGTVEPGLRSDPKPLIISATQSGVTVGYTFDFAGFCAGTTTTPPGPNQPPVAAAFGNLGAMVGTAFNVTVPAFSDPDGDALTYSGSIVPANGLLFNPANRLISGTPSATGVSSVTITATDTGGLSANLVFNITVVPAATPPVAGTGLALVAPAYNCTTGVFTFSTTGGNGSAIEYRAIGITNWTTTAGPFIVRPAADAQPFPLQARYVGQPASEVTFTWDSRAACSSTPPVANSAPVAPSVGPQSATAGVAFSLTVPVFTDPNGDVLTYSANGLTGTGLAFDAASRIISGVPSQSGTINVTITGTDPGPLSAQVSFTINVSANPVSGSVSPTLTLVAPAYNCTTGVFTFSATGGNGSAIEYRAIGITNWTTTAGPFIVRPAADAQPFLLQARYVGQPASEVTYTWNFQAVCGSPRLSAIEPLLELSVQVLGNPVAGENVTVEVRGAEGQSLQFRVVDAQGQVTTETRIRRADAVEQQQLKLGRNTGLYLLQISTPTQTKTVRVLKME